MKQKLIIVYLTIAFGFWVYLSFWGLKAYKGFAYNLGGALFWPAVLFPSVGKGLATIIIVGGVAYFSFFKKLR